MSDVGQVVAQMAGHGMPPLPANHPILDGKYKRFGPGKKSWYILREMTLKSGRTVVTGAFGFFQGENRNTVPVTVDMEEMSEEERAEYSRQQRAAEKAETEKRENAARLAANRARDQWSKGYVDAYKHPYLVRKQVPADGLRVSADGMLLIPLVREGKLMGLQKIDGLGGKKLNKDMDAIGVMHVLGTPAGAPVIAVGEGYATCASARHSVAPGYDLPAAMALTAGNIMNVAKSLRRDHPEAHLLLLADDDYRLAERFIERLREEFKVSEPVPIDGATHRVVADDGETVEVTAWWRTDPQGIDYIEADMRRGRLVRQYTYKNAGVASCHAAVKAVGNASVVKPLFADRAGRKLTDFNDLHVEEGLEAVAAQIGFSILAAQQPKNASPTRIAAEAAQGQPHDAGVPFLAAQQLETGSPAPSPAGASPESRPPAADSGQQVSPPPPGAEQPRASATEEPPAEFAARFDADADGNTYEVAAEMPNTAPAGDRSAPGEGGEETARKKDKPKKVYGQAHWDQVDDVLENFILIYGEDLVWDCRQRMLMKVSAMRTIVANNDVMKFWSGEARKWVLKKNIVFDPTETPSPAASGPTATVNLFSGWKMRPKKGNCLQIRVLLSHLCDGNEEMETWILRWLAYPLRNPGAKMETSIIMHGDEGSGKNFFFEKVVKAIYGEYGYVIGNAQLESNFNDWASMKLFMVADEVVTRSELKQMKGKLKYLVSGDTVIVNPKGLPEHSEANQMNFVFLSNELQPLALDKTDRRYLVVWTPPALSKEFYEGVWDEIKAGGIEAFYHYLVHELDMGNFNEHTKPIYNEAKDSLIEKSLAPAERFYREWSRGLLPLPFVTCAVQQLYDAFQVWCNRSGESKYTSLTLFSPSVERYAGETLRKKAILYEYGEKVKQRYVFLVGEHPPGKTLRDWAEAASSVFETELKAYRHRGGGNVEG
jgi:putative DNA primase/helicase